MMMRTKHFISGATGTLLIFSLQCAHAQEIRERYIFTGPDPELLKNDVTEAGGKIVTRLRYHSGYVIELNPAQAVQIKTAMSLRTSVRGPEITTVTEEEPETLERDGKVELIDAAAPMVLDQDVSLLSTQKTPWGIQAVHAPEAFEWTRGKNAVVCIIDTGVQRNHPDLEGSIAGGENVIAGQPETSWEDDNGHGTHVAGTIAARDNNFGVVGVAPEASVFAVKALNNRGSGGFSSLAEGVRSCIAHGANIINMSLGTPEDVGIIRRAVRDAIDAGIVLVAAAGNEKGPVDYPAKLSGVIAVSAITSDKKFAYFSNRGPQVTFAAPGTRILSTYLGSRYAIAQGTSQASPHVAGVAALMISNGVESKNVASRLRGEDLGLPREQQGSGCIDALQSLMDTEFGLLSLQR